MFLVRLKGKNESKIEKKDILCELKCELMEGNKVQNKHGMNLNVDSSVKIIVYVKKNITQILLSAVAKMENI